MVRDSTRSYAGRQVDLELLKHVDDPASFISLKRVHPEVEPVPRIVSGIEKAVQRYAKLFLTHLGTVKLDRNVGSTILHQVGQGKVNNTAELNHQYALANGSALRSIRADDADTDTFGAIPDDERIVSTTLVDLELKYDALTGGRVHIHVFLTTAAGEGYTFVIPVAAGIS